MQWLLTDFTNMSLSVFVLNSIPVCCIVFPLTEISSISAEQLEKSKSSKVFGFQSWDELSEKKNQKENLSQNDD